MPFKIVRNDRNISQAIYDEKAARRGGRRYPDLEEYIAQNFVEPEQEEENAVHLQSSPRFANTSASIPPAPMPMASRSAPSPKQEVEEKICCDSCLDLDFEEHESKLEERMRHMSDTFSEYLLYLIKSKGLDNVSVYKKAIVDKKIFSKIKNHKDYHPQKMTVLCLCVGANLNLDETKDLLARAGYALSPCDKIDIIFQYFIENKLYDMIELDIQLEEHGLPCIID